jgi:hypothetical protein
MAGCRCVQGNDLSLEASAKCCSNNELGKNLKYFKKILF